MGTVAVAVGDMVGVADIVGDGVSEKVGDGVSEKVGVGEADGVGDTLGDTVGVGTYMHMPVISVFWSTHIDVFMALAFATSGRPLPIQPCHWLQLPLNEAFIPTDVLLATWNVYELPAVTIP